MVVYDFGGGTFDVTVISVAKPQGKPTFLVLSTDGDTHLGGQDIDNALVDLVCATFQRQFGKNPRSDPRAIWRVRAECEKAKVHLSQSQSVEIEMELMKEDFCMEVSRTDFINLIQPILDKTLRCVECALKNANLNKTMVHDVILVGGSTRIPRVSDMLREYFGKTPRMTVDADEAVAIGAALAGKENGCESVVLTDVTPLSIGVSVLKDRKRVFHVIVPRNTPLPCQNFGHTFTTVFDDQQMIDIEVS